MVEVVPRRRPVPVRWLHGAWAVLAAVFDFLPYPVSADVLVRARGADVPLLSVPVSLDDHDAVLLQLQRDLAELTPQELTVQWGRG